MTIVSLEDAQANLAALIQGLSPNEEVVITRDGKAVAKLTGAPPAGGAPRILGGMKGSVLYIAEDFDAPLDDFKDYME
jgi:antitoxin (DNA-binding transcriptional repressor) of toxin-antitoxin stability system